MAKITIEIEMDNAAFDDMPGTELGDILTKLAKRAYENPDRGALSYAMGSKSDPRKAYDMDGNSVGTTIISGRWLD